MALFDSIISEANERFGLGNKAGGLLASLLSLMTDQNQGGFDGFLNLFKSAGLSDSVSGWISSGDSDELSREQVVSVLGENTISQIADQHDLSTEETTSALGYMIPAVVDRLTPDGTVPAEKDLLSKIGDFLSGIGGAVAGAAIGAAGVVGAVASGAADKVGDAAGATLDASKKVVGAVGDKVGDAAGATVDAGKKVVGAVGDSVGGAFKSVGNAVGDATDGGGSMLKWLIPLILLLLLLALGWMFCRPATPTATNANTNSNANKGATNANTAKVVDSSFKLVAKDGKYVASGVVADQKTLDDLKAKLTAQFGEGNVDFSGLKVDTTAKAFGTGWLDGFTKLLPNLKDWKNGAIAFVGSAITEAAGLPKAALDAIKSLFGTGWKLPVSIVGEGDAIKQANEEAKKELETAGTLEEVVKALNVSIINFASGKSDIPADAKPILEKAAEVLKKQPDGTSVEIGGYTDNVGKAEVNKALSQSRADSVKKALIELGVKDTMLKAVGYGDANPVGDNATKEGQFANRRIEYKKSDGTAVTSTTTVTKPADANTKPATANTNATK